MFSAERIKDLLEKQLADCEAVVIDDVGDGEHFSARVASTEFVGKSLVQQHQLVYKALAEHMHRDIHALALKTYTPDRWSGQEG